MSLGTENVLKHFNQNWSVIKILQINLNSVFVIRLLSNEIDQSVTQDLPTSKLILKNNETNLFQTEKDCALGIIN